jgi:sulfite reductase (NADPH) flavoprotein alpha-component
MHPVYVLFGTESGNAQGLAKRAGEALTQAGLTAKVVDMMDFAAKNLPELRRLLVITSTYGNGDPPSNAEELHGYLMRKCPELPDLAFSVCALGDTTYDRFAQCGKDFDRRLGELGARRLHDRQDCDVDYDPPFEAWLARVVPALVALDAVGAPSTAPATLPPSARIDPPGTRRNPLLARVVVNRSLHAPGATKDTRHVELSFPAGALGYELGDSIGVWPSNDPALVAAVLHAAGADGSARVEVGSEALSLEQALSTRLEVVLPDVRLAERLFGPLSMPDRQALLGDRHVIDLLHERPTRLAPEELVSLLRPLAPRQYSIASSLRAHPGQAHLTVSVVRYELRGRRRSGVASGYLADRAAPGAEVPIYVHPNPSFRLAAPDVPILMIGPGTGIAPFRAFLEERRAIGAKGGAWLFFGSRNEKTDFLYGDELRGLVRDGTLTRLDLAFSRDQPEKIYVQHRMRERARELFRFVEEGATIYVCGDAHHMAVDVHDALVQILSEEGRVSREAARMRLEQLAAAGRYQKDVY